MSSPYRARIAKVRKLLGSYGRAAVLLGSAPTTIRSNDTAYPYRQDSNLYYLTGSTEPELLLFISTELKKPLLLIEPESPHRRLWEGPRRSLKPLARALAADIVEVKDLKAALRSKLDNHEYYFYQNLRGTLARKIAEELINAAPANTVRLPKLFASADALLEKLRVVKDRTELSLMQTAATVTVKSLHDAVPSIQPRAFEWQIASTVASNFARHGCPEAFTTIAASGVNAATLHHVRGDGRLKDGELLLLDCGAEHKLYAADITRVFPISGEFTPQQREIYTIVLRAQKAALRRVRDGALIKSVYDAAARELTKGLLSLKVLKGSLSSLLKKKAFRPYFPHGIGHSLGIDVHDLGPFRANTAARLRTGMVFTIEPGLYFPKRVGKAPPCGIRIEDSVVVTKTGCKILTAAMPKEIVEIEKLMRQARRAI